MLSIPTYDIIARFTNDIKTRFTDAIKTRFTNDMKTKSADVITCIHRSFSNANGRS